MTWRCKGWALRPTLGQVWPRSQLQSSQDQLKLSRQLKCNSPSPSAQLLSLLRGTESLGEFHTQVCLRVGCLGKCFMTPAQSQKANKRPKGGLLQTADHSTAHLPASFHNERSRRVGWGGSGREAREGGGVGTPVADSCWQKTTKFRKANILQLKKIKSQKKCFEQNIWHYKQSCFKELFYKNRCALIYNGEILYHLNQTRWL